MKLFHKTETDTPVRRVRGGIDGINGTLLDILEVLEHVAEQQQLLLEHLQNQQEAA